MPKPAYAPPEAPDTIVYFRGDMRKLDTFGKCFAGIERIMGYRSPNILWGTLAMSPPTRTPDGAALYRIDLPKPVHLYDALFLYATDGTMLREGHYTGRVSLHLSDGRFAPAFSSMDGLPAVARRDPHPDGVAGHCEITLCLEGLRRIEIEPAAQDPALAYFKAEVDFGEIYNDLRDRARAVVRSLTSLLHPDEYHPPDLTHPLF